MNPLRVAIVGSGPSGFYAAEALLRAGEDTSVDMYEKLPVPFGLVRYGVAPDHPKLKQVTSIFSRIADMPGFRFFGNIHIGRDIAVDRLGRHYHAVIFACGAERERDLGIPGESLSGSHSARGFVAWYNGHPDYRDLRVDLDCDTAAVIGQGNVALDVARILLKDPGDLQATDIADHAYEALRASRIRTVHLIGRRSPAQARFTPRELGEFAGFEDCHVTADPAELRLGPVCEAETGDPRNAAARANLQILRSFGRNGNLASRRCRFQFMRNPVRLGGTDRVESITLERTVLTGGPFRQKCVGTGAFETVSCGLVVRCIGYRTQRLADLPVDRKTGVLKNRSGRLIDANKPLPGLYATGWAKRGPSGCGLTKVFESVGSSGFIRVYVG